MVIKKCIVCGKEFDAKGTDKTCSKECRKEHRKQYSKQYHRQYRQNNKEYLQQYHQQYYQQYYQNNKEKIREYGKQHYQDNKEYYQQIHHEYYQNNKEHIQQNTVQRHKRKVNKLVEQYDGDLGKILENIPSGWHLREAKMQVWFNESYYDGIMAKRKSTPYCEVTGEKDNLVIHHLWSFNTHPELGNDPANMVRITEEVHNAFHNQYGRGNNTPQQWEEFVNNYLHNSANSNQSSNSLTE